MIKTKNLRDTTYIQQKDEFDYLSNLISNSSRGLCTGILFFGPPGTGKTLLAITLAKYFKSEYYIIDGSPDLDRRDLEGYWELKQGGTKFNFGPLTQAISTANEEGICFIILNEINAIRESEQISLNSLLSENHINLISKGFERYELKEESKLIVIGTMNKGVVGINKLQEAFEDRFIVCSEINYPEKKKEIEITKSITGCNHKIAEIVVDAARQIRKQAIEDFSLTKIFSTRLIINFCLVISRMPVQYLKHNIQNMIINKLADTQEEKKSVVMILDGKMFETKLKEELSPIKKKSKAKPIKEITELETDILIEMKQKVEEYIQNFGRDKLVNSKNKVMWKFVYWLWRNHQNVLLEYIRLTEEYKFHEIYQKQVKKTHTHNGKITLRYIKWLYRSNQNYLDVFMKRLSPIL
ncbi:MAG: AAA domain-containing protein [Candidatus Lokiarchaeota archaeon]|nr:AAA domain-containing protein [Candidatus Lokiarchaeota archaeon]MBD3201539.1 AAA domain-containing protein [Candidatus Lokiarchaeota archaeon]